MSYTIKIRSKRHAAQIRKFVRRTSLPDNTSQGAQFQVGNLVHIWLDEPVMYMAWGTRTADNNDIWVTLRELYAMQG